MLDHPVVIGFIAMAAMAMTAPVGSVTGIGASGRSPSSGRYRGARSNLSASSLKGQKLNVELNVVRRAEKSGGLQVVMTATLPPQQFK